MCVCVRLLKSADESVCGNCGVPIFTAWIAVSCGPKCSGSGLFFLRVLAPVPIALPGCSHHAKPPQLRSHGG